MNAARKLLFIMIAVPVLVGAMAALGSATFSITVSVYPALPSPAVLPQHELLVLAWKANSTLPGDRFVKAFPLVERDIGGQWEPVDIAFHSLSAERLLAPSGELTGVVDLLLTDYPVGSYRVLIRCRAHDDSAASQEVIDSPWVTFSVTAHPANVTFFQTSAGIALVKHWGALGSLVSRDGQLAPDDVLSESDLSQTLAANPQLSTGVRDRIRLDLAERARGDAEWGAVQAHLQPVSLSSYPGPFGGTGARAQYLNVLSGWHLAQSTAAYDGWTATLDGLKITHPIAASVYSFPLLPAYVRERL